MDTSLSQGLTEISLKLTTHGRYIWNINSCFETKDSEVAIEKLKQINAKLKDTFPDYAQRGSGRVGNLEEM